MLSAQWQSRMLIVQSVDAYRTRGLYVHSYITFVQYWRVCRTLRVCMCVQCSHRQTHGSLRSGEYYRGVDHRRTRPITNRQAPHINPLHSDASPLCLSVSLSFFSFFHGSALSHSSPFSSYSVTHQRFDTLALLQTHKDWYVSFQWRRKDRYLESIYNLEVQLQIVWEQ